MLRDEIAKYTELSGNNGEKQSIGIIGAYLDGYDKGISDSKNQNKWIPVSERLPEGGTNSYLICCDDGYIDVIMYSSGRWLIDDNVIAWKPLPEPYNKG